MRIAVPKEIMNNENRVALTPGGAQTLVHDGHEVLIETGAGEGASFPDSEYEAAGATIVGTAEDTWAQAELLLKVKEPLEAEYQYLRPDLTVFTYLHLAADRPLTEALVEAKTTAIAYETVTDRHGTLPLLTPMSQVAGRLAAIEGTHHLLSTQGGRGLLVSGVPGTQPARVVVIGGGQVGASAVAMAHGLRAEVTVLDSVGFALGDFSALRCALDATEGTDLLGWVDLVADPDDPAAWLPRARFQCAYVLRWVAVSKRRMLSMVSPNRSRRTGPDSPGGKMSMMPPRIA